MLTLLTTLILIGYQEVPDCKYPSKEVNCYVDEHGQKHCQIQQDERCK